MTDQRRKLDAFAERQRKVQTITQKQEQMLRINQRTSYDSTDTSSLDSSHTENYDTGHANLDVTFTDQRPLSRLRKRSSSQPKFTQKDMEKSAKLNAKKSKTVPPAKKIKIQSCVTLTENQTNNCLQTIKKEKLSIIPSSTLAPSKVNTQPQNDRAKEYIHLERESPNDPNTYNYSSKNDASRPEIGTKVNEDTQYDNLAVRNLNTLEPRDSLSYASLADLKKRKEDICYESLAVTCNDIDLKICATSPATNTLSAIPAIHCDTSDANSFQNQATSETYNVKEDTYTESKDVNKIGICDDYLVKNFVNLTENEQNFAIDTLSLRGSSNGSPVKKHVILSETDNQDIYQKKIPVDGLLSCSTYDENLGKRSAVPPEIKKQGIYLENTASINLGSLGMCDDKSVKTFAISPEKQVTKPENLNIDDIGSCRTYHETPVKSSAMLPNIDKHSTFPDKLDNVNLDSDGTCGDNTVNNFVILSETNEQNTNPDNLAIDELESRKAHSDNSLHNSAILPEIEKLDAKSNNLAIDDLGSCGIHEDDSPKNSAVLPETEVYDNLIIDKPSIQGTQGIDSTKELKTKSEFLCEITGKMLTSEIDHDEDSVEKEGLSIPLEEKRKRSRPKNSLHKSYTDFMSETEDLSAGSSDLWSANESDSDTGSETKKKNKKRRKKHVHKTKEIAIKERVKMRNESKYRKSRKNSGKSYITKSGSERPEKSMKENPCQPNKCLKKCYEISDTRRKSLFDHFWGLDSQRRRDWIVRCVRTTQVKRKKTKAIDSRRQCSHEYVINEGEGFRPVCQQFILSTLDITQKFVLYNIKNSVDGIAKEDARKGNVPPKYSAEAKEYVKQYIESLPAVPSHYCRENSKRLYLPQEFKNVTNLYRIYCLDCKENCKEIVSERIFTSIFKNDYNLSFHVPKKDKCLVCLKAENGEEKTDQDKENFKNHLEEKKAGHKRFKIHQNLIANDTLTVSFDLQKVLNTPYGSSMLLYYARKYAVYNLTFYESTTQNGQCYIWGEADGKRGANEIASCIYQYLVEIDKRTVIQNVLFYCDSCFGQNKNKVVLTAMHHFLRVSKNIETIQINYLLPGHTYMPVDSMHSIIEKEVKQIIVYSPNEWPTYIQSARKRPRPYQVNVLEHYDFKNWEPLVSKTFTPETLKHVQMSKIRIVTLKKKDLNTMKIKFSMAENAEVNIVPLCINSYKGVKGKGKGKGRGKKNKEKNSGENEEETLSEITLQPLYQNRLPISNVKFKDLIRLCDNGTIPKRFHSEYKNLPHGESTKDTLQSTDDEDDAQDGDLTQC